MAPPSSFKKLLNSCQEMQLSHLRPLVDRMFENADIALLDFAEKAQSNSAQVVFFEAMNEVRKRRKSIEHDFYAEIIRSYANFPATPDDQKKVPDMENGLDGLSLVGTEEMEASVATLNATGKLANRIMDRIFALKQRLAIVNDGETIEENQIPGGPTWLGAAWQKAVSQLELENKVRLVFIVLFDKYVLSQATSMFDEYNKRFIMADILPHLRYVVRKQPGGVEIIRRNDPNGSDVDTHAADSVESTQDQTPSELGDELFGRICELMSGRRAGSPGDGSPAGKRPAVAVSPAGTPGSGVAISAELMSQLSTMQSSVRSATLSRSSSEFIENIEIDQGFINRLQNTLVEERERIFGGVDRRQLPDADNNVIELVGMLFEYMLREESLPNVVKALLSRLHTPLLKVAVLDRQFFTRTKHPARKLLNEMTSAGIRWVDETQIDQSVFPKMKDIVDRILVEFDHDVTIFEKFSDEFSNHIKELRQRAELIEKRTSEAASGQDKLLAARGKVQEELARIQQGKPVGDAVSEFLQRLLADKLTFILLRNAEGTESKEWKQATQLALDIVTASQPARSEQLRNQRLQSLEELQKQIRNACQSLHQANKEKLLLDLFDSQKKILETVAEAAAPVTEPATGTAPAAVSQQAEAVTSAAAQEPAKPVPAVSREQRAMMEKLNATPFGTWFEFSTVEGGKHRAKLSWRSTVTEKFMFVDQMGVKASVISMQELADGMLGGRVSILNVEKKPFVDRALGAIHKMLDRSTRKTASA